MVVELKDNLASVVISALSQCIMSTDTVIKMNDEEIFEYLSNMEQFESFRNMLKSKTSQELTQDLEIKDLLNKNKRGIVVFNEELREALGVIQKANK